MNRIDELFKRKPKRVLNIYITAGYPNLTDTVSIVKSLANAGVDMIEIGMPFSDPLADGPVIQESSTQAIDNGITLDIIFNQIEEIRKTVDIPILLMGYYNQLLQYGELDFFTKAKSVGIDGFIIPDLPLEEFQSEFKSLFDDLDLNMVFLVTPQTSDERIILLDKASSGFLYLVSSASTTGAKKTDLSQQTDYFERINALKLKNPTLIGFGISNNANFNEACNNASGAIIGSAFIKMIGDSVDFEKDITEFIGNVLGK